MQVLVSGRDRFPAPNVWDGLVAADPSGHLLQTWAWGDLKARFGWEAVRVAVAQDGALVAKLDLARAARHRAGMGFFRDRRPQLYTRICQDI